MSQRTLANAPYLNSNLFSSYYLDERIGDLDDWGCDEEASQALEKLSVLYDEQRDLVAAYDEDNLRTDWIDPILTILDHKTISETPLPDSGGFIDRLLFESDGARMDAVHLRDDKQTRAMYGRGIAVLEAKQWDADFESRFHENRQYRDASHQIKYYLERTPDSIQWGILTNGRKWRLYGTKDYETQTFYEVDLPELIETGDLEGFKYFFAFFRADAFYEVDKTSFLDRVWAESERAAQELGEDLQDNVFTALRKLGEGFVESNDLDIKPGDEEALSELKEQSLVLLYRLMFVLYAEARGLIHPDSSAAEREYAENFSLDEKRVEIHETVSEGEPLDVAYSTRSTRLWSRLEDLFRLIDEGNEELGIPAYNGGLFDRDEHAFLSENEVTDQYVAEVIHRLSTTEGNGGSVLADYADLDTRHLGSIYEGLLEHQFRLAEEDLAAVREDGAQVWKPVAEVTVAESIEEVDKGELYVVNDQGERKATGAYYTPDYVVTYIVEETLGPLLEEIRENLANEGFESGTQEYVFRFGNRVLDLKVLDPAMGSGHFLTKANGYLAEQVQEAAREAEIEDVMREEQVRRQVAKEVIYGVDINPMAVELAKLSMWLETLAADQPLAFLDHHLKVGNSLVGSGIEAIEGLETDAGDGDQSSLAEFGAVRRGTIEHLMDVYQEFLAIENEDLEDVKAMERKYAEIEQDELRQRLVAMANVHTAEGFGVEVPGGAYERMADAIQDDDQWASLAESDWFKGAQTYAHSLRFFHWKFEFPEVFFTDSGEIDPVSGFDVTVGNPPYGMLQPHNSPEDLLQFLREWYDASAFKVDMFVLFTELSINLTSVNGRVGLILPNTFVLNVFAENIRDILLDKTTIDKLLVSDDYLFPDADVHNAIIVTEITPEDVERLDEQINVVRRVDPQYLRSEENRSKAISSEIRQRDLAFTDEGSWNIRLSDNLVKVFEEIQKRSTDLGDIVSISRGLISGDRDKYFSEKREGENWYPILTGSDVHRYSLSDPKEFVLFDRPETAGGSWDEEMHFQENKLLVRQIGSFPQAAIDPAGYCITGNIFSLIIQDNVSPYYVLSILNSALIRHYWLVLFQDFKQSFTELKAEHIRQIPIRIVQIGPENILNNNLVSNIQQIFNEYRTGTAEYEELASSIETCLNCCKEEPGLFHDLLVFLSKQMIQLKEERQTFNLNLPDYLGNYSSGFTLSEFDSYQPPSGVAESVLAETAETRENLRVGHVEVEESDDTQTILATARYKPEDEDGHELGPYGYTETEPLSAMEFHGLSEAQAALVREFIPYAVDEEIAGFLKEARKSISLIDRLEAITLPQLKDVEDGLKRYLKNKQRAEELDEKIEKTDRLIDEIVYELYGLTDEEIEIIEEAVAD